MQILGLLRFAIWRLFATPAKQMAIGANGRIRTHDLRFTKPLLYQLSYVGSHA